MRSAIRSRGAQRRGGASPASTPAAAGGDSTTRASLADLALATWRSVPAWLKRPDFLLVVVAGALLRLLWLDSTSFLGDQAELLALARAALDLVTLPLTGIRSSLGSMNPPAAIYLLLPFARLDPFWATLFGALANVAAIVLLYRLADRFAGRAAAFAAGLPYATAWGPVWYSRFLWQQNLLAPVLLLFFWTLCRGVATGRRGWLGWNVLLWGIAVQLHPTAAPLLLLTVVGALLARATLRRRDLLAAALALGALSLPFAVWELLTRGSDLARLGGSAAGKSIVDWSAVQLLLGLLQPASRDSLGGSSLYAGTYPPLAPLALAMALLGVAATLWLVVVVLRPLAPPLLPRLRWLARLAATNPAELVRRIQRARRARQASPLHPGASPDASAFGASHLDAAGESADLDAALADPWWRFRALLALWELAPLVFMLRHSQRIYPHYLLVVLPATFLIVGLFLAWATRQVIAFARAQRAPLRRRAIPVGARPASPVVSSLPSSMATSGPLGGFALLVAVTLLLALGQAYGTAAWIFTIERGAFDATPAGARYGLPLDAQRAALLDAQRAARPLGASVVVATDDLHQEPLGYLATTGYGPASVYQSDACLVTPAAGGRPLVTLAVAPGAAGELLPRLQGATALAAPGADGSVSPALYRIPPGATLPGETMLPDDAAAAAGPRLAGYLLDRGASGSRLLLRWIGAPALAVDPAHAPRYFDGASPAPGSPPVAHYWFSAQPIDAAGRPLGQALVAQCPRLAWAAGEDVYAWAPVSPALAASAVSWRVAVEGAPYLVSSPTLGPLRFTAGDVREGPRAHLGDGAFTSK